VPPVSAHQSLPLATPGDKPPWHKLREMIVLLMALYRYRICMQTSVSFVDLECEAKGSASTTAIGNVRLKWSYLGQIPKERENGMKAEFRWTNGR
jgi:hypothetical protein